MESEVMKEEDMVEVELRLSLGRTYNVDKELETRTKSSNNEQEIDPLKAKREIQALRRREAKKKREEKKQLLKKRVCDKKGICLKAKDFGVREGETGGERESKKIKNVDDDTCQERNSCQIPAVFSDNWSPLQQGKVPVGFTYSRSLVHDGPSTSGLLMPFWFMGIYNNNFRWGQSSLGSGHNVGYAYESELNGGGSEGGNRKGGSIGSSVCTSYTGSNRRSATYEGTRNKESRSSSIHSIFYPKADAIISHQEQTATSHGHNSKLLADQETDYKHEVDRTATSNPTQSTQTKSKEDSKSGSEQNPSAKYIAPGENPTSSESKASNQSNKRAPEPEIKNQISSIFPHMPCVMARGTGPNGKTVNGFLYRYNEAEVSILCVCHGSSFSPAEFVKHAGATDVSNPLKHITVVRDIFT